MIPFNYQKDDVLEKYYPSDVMKHVKHVVGIIYDLIPLLFPKNYLPTKELKYQYALRMEAMCARTEHFFSISSSTANDFNKYLGIPQSSITVINGGVDVLKFAKYRLPLSSSLRQNQVVFVAGDEGRKNTIFTVHCFCLAQKKGLIPPDAKCVIVGKLSQATQSRILAEAKEQDLPSQNLILTGFISDDELVQILSKTTATIFPSLYEGLGLPVLESYAAGTPVFAANNSSLQELTFPKALFDPVDEDDFCRILSVIFSKNSIREESLKFGLKLLKEYSWENTVQKMRKQFQILNGKTFGSKNRIAIFCPMPPQKTGIAPYTLLTHNKLPDIYDIIAEIPNKEAAMIPETYDGHFNENIIPYSVYQHLGKDYYKKKLYVIGNSFHHLPTLRDALDNAGTCVCAFYLHEASIIYLWFTYFNFDFKMIQDFFRRWYPELAQVISSAQDIWAIERYCLEHDVCGVRPLVMWSHVNHLFVNTPKAYDMVLNDFPSTYRNKIRITRGFLPLPDLRSVPSISYDKGGANYVFGSFGTPLDDTKSVLDIIQAIEILNKKGYYIKLMLAGYKVNEYLERMTLQYQYLKKLLIAIDSPDDQTLLSLMKSVDCAIQLRPFTRGESSGCISQLLGAGVHTIVTKGFIDEQFKPFVTFVEPYIKPEKLASIIESQLKQKNRFDPTKIIEQYSFSHLAQSIYAAMKNDSPHHPKKEKRKKTMSLFLRRFVKYCFLIPFRVLYLPRIFRVIVDLQRRMQTVEDDIRAAHPDLLRRMQTVEDNIRSLNPNEHRRMFEEARNEYFVAETILKSLSANLRDFRQESDLIKTKVALIENLRDIGEKNLELFRIQTEAWSAAIRDITVKINAIENKSKGNGEHK